MYTSIVLRREYNMGSTLCRRYEADSGLPQEKRKSDDSVPRDPGPNDN